MNYLFRAYAQSAYFEPADIQALKQSISLLYNLLRQTGIGALPVISVPSAVDTEAAQIIPTEEMMLADAMQISADLVGQNAKTKDNTAVVANLFNLDGCESLKTINK